MDQDEHEIRQLISLWMLATNAGDTETVLNLMSEDVIFLVTGQPPMMGRAAFAEASKAQAIQSFKFDGHSEIQEIKVLGDWAYMWTKLSVNVTRPDGQTMTRAGHTLSILRKENGKWVLARDANMLAPAANK
ncbi:MAG TPA: SgcJ/EcaC family oxidoreductase [Gammaproteobacteria bacterium]|nr:SgcJ/EcaC family oxidoreductase [Gammaproteobacteria bacterium]